MKKVKYDLVYIYWHDAAMHGTAQVDLDEVKTYGLVHGYVAGWLVNETKDFITIAMDFFPASGQIPKDNFRTLQSYPKSGIEKMTRIKTLKLRPEKKQRKPKPPQKGRNQLK